MNEISAEKIEEITEVFQSSAPTDNPNFFVGREQEQRCLSRAIITTGKHIVLFGERGVGKTSLLKIVTGKLKHLPVGNIIEYSCSNDDTYESVFGFYLRETNQLVKEEYVNKENAKKMTSSIGVAVAKGDELITFHVDYR